MPLLLLIVQPNSESPQNFTYEYMHQEDGQYGGHQEETGSWNGLVLELIERRIDIGLSMGINSQRSRYIDFSQSFFEDQVRSREDKAIVPLAP